ncbi:hypothetical protein BDY21DRAFT_355616 [Lineolata rhizophorae]|uniref:EF-hand superfamily Ca2+-modulated protein n=1 Tax=Lineolata rhizophorae TaxID=578093 RepID=A0A6A6NPI6_9PEZI|nr:hypothetical protein BDY21DRAFT_355616 [Lineolata rhizophorae]
MPPKRRGITSKGAQLPSRSSRRSNKLARQNDLTDAQENEIREAFRLFCEPLPAGAGVLTDDPESGSVLKREDIRRCLISLGLSPSQSDMLGILDALDPAKSGFVTYAHFLELAAIYLNQQERDPEDQSSEEGINSRVSSREATRIPREAYEAFELFKHGNRGPITLSHLRKVARELREEISDDILKDMILEANGGVRDDNTRTRGEVERGVQLEDFVSVMCRAGVFGHDYYCGDMNKYS